MPTAVARTRIVTMVDAPLASVPIEQSAACAETSHWTDEDRKVTPAPSVWVRRTPVAGDGPSS